MKLHEIFREERPREKLLAHGAETLSNAELMALLIGSGRRGMNALDIAQSLIAASEGSLRRIASMGRDSLSYFQGIGDAKSAAIHAAFELGKRCIAEGDAESKLNVGSSLDAFRIMRPVIGFLDHEECWIMMLSSANYIKHKEMISRGGTGHTAMEPRIIVRKALERNAVRLILAHNHPSGNPSPTKEDLRMTEALKKAVNTFDILLLDHIIVCRDRYFSFADNSVETFASCRM